MKRALVIGSSGQDGRLLVDALAPTCAVLGLDVGQVSFHGRRDDAVAGELPAAVDLHDPARVAAIVRLFAPDELYYLAARHHSSEERPDDATELRASVGVNFLGLLNVLEAVRTQAPSCRVFYAGSSHMFGTPSSTPQNESTPFVPKNPYSIAKVAGAHACALYRERHGLHVSVGILYNHESPLRGEHFVSRRIVEGAKRAARDPGFRLTLGSLASVVDWGYAPDYVDAMVRIVSHDTPDDYVVATGEPHTVEDFVEAAFAATGVDWRAHVVLDEGRLHVAPSLPVSSPRSGALVGDASKLRATTGWKPSITFEEMVRRLVAATP